MGGIKLENFDNNTYSAPLKLHHLWFRILIIGFIIYVATIIAFISTGNPNVIPTIVLLGNSIIPVSFVTFFYERRNRFSISMFSTSLSFFYGGLLGTITAAILEPIFISDLNFNTSFIVGIIEELTKLIGVFLIIIHRKDYSKMDGLILGAAAGMGFAAFESIGYTFTDFLQSGGNLTEVVTLTLIRGIASPVGHGTWTAILASVIFSERSSGGFKITPKVILAFVTVVVLHGLWDGFPFVINLIIPTLHSILFGQVTIGIVGLLILYKHWREAKMQPFLEHD
jgi:protease PrsW